MEVWKDIKGFEELYQVSNLGMMYHDLGDGDFL